MMAAVRIGDIICLFSEEKSGFLHSLHSSAVYNEVGVKPNQDREGPDVLDSKGMCWKIMMNSRYKLDKKYRTLKATKRNRHNYQTYQRLLTEAKQVADAEAGDNDAEQRKHHGEPLIYGQIIELRNMFSGLYLHISTTTPSQMENKCMKVELRPFHANHTKFRVMPKYKVKAEGDVVTLGDQVVLESIKSPGHYIHMSDLVFPDLHPLPLCHEANLSVKASTFTLYRSCSPPVTEDDTIRGGDTIRLFHKEIESYICAEGNFGLNAEITLDVHCRVRKIDIRVPKTVFPSSSAIVYWQIEPVGAGYSGEILRWGQQVRLRHVVTRHYFKVLSDDRVSVTQDRDDPFTIFKFHPVTQDDLMGTYSFCRIEHLMTQSWLHATQEDFLQSKQNALSNQHPKKKSIPKADFSWTSATLLKLGVAKEMQFADVFTIQPVQGKHLEDCKFMAGQLPVVQQFNEEISRDPDYLWHNYARCLSMLQELKDFMLIGGKGNKPRQKLLRNFRVIEALIQLLQLIQDGFTERTPVHVIEAVYEVLRVYCLGDSRKNELYLSRHHEFFLSRLSEEGPQSASAAHTLMELVKDNMKIIDRITKQDIRSFVRLLRRKKDYRYLELLGALCVCNGVALPDNQRYINETWLVRENKDHDESTDSGSSSHRAIDLISASKKYNKCTYHTALGQAISKEINVLYVSKDNRKTWTSVYDMLQSSTVGYDPDLLFLEHQLDLFTRLCHGNNEYCIDTITDEQKHVTWEEAFCCLRESNLPARLRAKYCNLIECAFITTEDIQATLNQLRLTYVYHEAKAIPTNKLPNTGQPQDDEEVQSVIRRRVEELQNWIADFLYAHQRMVANQPDQSTMIERVLTLVRHMVSYGYYGDTGQMRVLLKPLLELIDGRNDVPYDIGKEAATERDEVRQFHQYRRFKQSPSTALIVAAKFVGLEILELFFNLRFNTRLETFVGEFRRLHERFYQTETEVERERNMGIVVNFDNFAEKEETVNDYLTQLFTHDPAMFDDDEEKQQALLDNLRKMFLASAFFKGFPIDTVLLDLCNYEYDYIVRKAKMLLNRVFSAHSNLFTRSLQAQILLTDTSCDVFANVVNMLPMLRRLSLTRLEETQVEMVDQFLDVLKGYCCLEEDVTSPHPINQRIIYNQGVLNDLITILLQPASQESMENFKCLRLVQRKTWGLVGALARENPTVQIRLFERLDELLNIEGTESCMALALSEVFLGNKLTCMKVTLTQVKHMMKLAGLHQKKAPELLVMLKALVKYEVLDMPLRRNQDYVMKSFTQQRTEVAGVLDKSKKERLSSLREGPSAVIQYTASLIDLLASCAERGNSFTESLCQGILSIEELLDLLNDEQIGDHVRRPLLRFLHHVYFKSAVKEGQEILEYMTDKRLWSFLLLIRKSFMTLTQCAEKRRGEVKELLKLNLSEEVWNESLDTSTIDTVLTAFPDEEEESTAMKQEQPKRVAAMDPVIMCRAFHYVIDAVLPFLQTFYTCSFVLKGRRSKRETEVAHYLALGLQNFVDKVAPLMTRAADKKVMVTAHRALLSATRVPLHMMEALQSRSGLTKRGAQHSDVRKQYQDYYKEENDINLYFDKFARGYKHVYEGQNTVKAQLGIDSDKEYTSLGSDEELPLGKEFQSLVVRFINKEKTTTEEKYKLASNLVRQLSLEGRPHGLSENARINQEQLDVRCLQVLRALLHNQIVLMDPDEPSPISDDTKEKLSAIRELQEFLVKENVIDVVVLHLDSGSDELIREILGLLSNMLYQGNRKVQEALYKYFTSTREEKFFLTCRDRLHLSAQGLKERRMLEGQHEELVVETVQQVKHLKQLVRTGSLGKTDFASEVNSSVLRTSDSLRAVELELSLDELYNSRSTTSRSQFLRDPDRTRSTINPSTFNESFRKPGLRIDAQSLAAGPLSSEWFDADEMDESQMGDDLMKMVKEWVEDLPMRDEGSLNVLLKVISLMCEGQYEKIQNYLRLQPDNFRSINVVSELTSFLGVLLVSDKSRSSSILVSLLQTLRDVISGNLKNRQVVVDDKICDSLQILLRETSQMYPTYETLRVQEAMGSLIRELLEDRSHGINKASYKAQTDLHSIVAEALSHSNLATIMCQCYGIEQETKGEDAEKMIKLARRVGFKYYQLLRQIQDLKPNMQFTEIPDCHEIVIPYYEKATMSIEVVCEGKLSKIYFPTTYQEALRKPVKEAFNYGVQRNDSERIKDFMDWSYDIMDDIKHTQKLNAIKLTRILTKAQFWFNVAMMLMSAFIMIMIMVVWQGDPTNLHTLHPVYRYPWGQGFLQALGILHYIITLAVFITFFIVNQPRPPNLFYKLRGKYKSWKKGEVYVHQKMKGKQCIRINLVSLKTFWYTMLLSFSLAGVFSQYFCVFHLLHLAEHVQLLKRAIGAVGQNAKSLILIYLFGFIFFMIFSLFNFAFYRNLFDGTSGTYCTAFYECLIVIHHHGLVNNLFEGVPPINNQPFAWYVGKAAMDVLFFIIITCIGLSMVFGVIVDTFAELRDNKWKTDQEMLGSCFICGRDSHEFESKPGGFQKHVKEEHNQWAYIFFWLHLQDTHKTDHSALEAYVSRKLKLGQTDFLPIDRALTLQRNDHDDSHLHLIEARMAYLVDHMRNLENQQNKALEESKQLESFLKCQERSKEKNYDIMAPTLNPARVERKVTFIEKPSMSGSDLERSILD